MISLVISTPWRSHGEIFFDLRIPTVEEGTTTAPTLLFVSSGSTGELSVMLESSSEATSIRWEPITESRLSLWSHLATAQRHKTVFVQDLADPRVSIVEAIPVALEFWDNLVTACCYDLEEFEVAGDEFTALEQLKSSIVDLYYILKSEADHLGPLPQRQWNYLRRMVREN